ncbi:MAG: adenylate/guanylate cyclase domain-containing protein [Chitinophagales bacterium]|nr:adenylate/guanylate cyclase domain-containing protein [Chitinophagales bacterium]
MYALLAFYELQFYDNFRNFIVRPESDSILMEAESFLPILKKYQLNDQYAMGFVFLGRANFTVNENKALAYFLIAISQKSSVNWVNSLSAFNLGVIYRRAENYEKAITYLKLCIEYDTTQVVAYNLISFYHAHLHQCDSAYKYLSLAGRYFDTKNNAYIRAKAYHHLCIYEYDSAVFYIKQCVAYWDTMPANSNTYHYLIYFNRDLYRIYKKQRHILNQQQAIDRIDYYTSNLQFDLMGIQAAVMGFEVLEEDAFERNDFKKAYLYRTQLEAVRDSSEKLGALNVYESIQTKNTYEEKLNSYELEAQQKEEAAKRKLQQQKLIGVLAAIVLAFLALLAFVQFRNNKKIKKEKDRSESLLLNILPEEVAEELKTKGTADAKLFNDVTVFFSDFKSFTTVSEKLSPQQLVNELHECFSAFDSIMHKYNIEKIKTVGDAYLAVCGLPVANLKHAEDVIKAALEIQQLMAERKKLNINREGLYDIRVGINSGSVVAGIVGVKKFAYDIWGDTVNTAARMEQNGEAGKVNISEATYELVKDKFNCEYRGEIEAKNKGKLKMYFVE